MTSLGAYPPHRRLSTAACLCLLLLLFLLGACGSSSTITPSSSPPPAPPTSTPPVVKVQKGPGPNGGQDQYFFRPNHFTVNAAVVVTFINETNAVFTLSSTPAHGMTGINMLEQNETEGIQFPTPGSFTIRSKEHPEAQLAATILGPASEITPYVTVVLAEKHGTLNSYFFRPGTIEIDDGYPPLLIVNQSDETQIVSIRSMQGVIVAEGILDKNESQLFQLAEDNVYTVSSKAHPDAKLTVNAPD